jgi:hypothetical protein
MYYLENDPTKAIYGVSTQTVPTADTAGYLVGYRQAFGVTTNPDNSINVLDYEGKAFISKFSRVATVGKTTTAQLACDSVSTNCTAGSMVTGTFTLDALAPAD